MISAHRENTTSKTFLPPCPSLLFTVSSSAESTPRLPRFEIQPANRQKSRTPALTMDTKEHHDVPHQPPPLQQPAYQHPSDQEPMPIQQHPPPPQAQGIPPPEPSNQVAVTAEENRDLDPRGQEWQFGLFSCFGDMKSSLLGCCLPCVRTCYPSGFLSCLHGVLASLLLCASILKNGAAFLLGCS